MAIIKFANGKAKLATVINYVSRKSKVYALGGKDCLAQNALSEMQSVKRAFNKEGGREYIHLIQSFSKKDNITPEKVHELGMKLAGYFRGYQVLVATHIDKEHLHSHLVINSVNFETGKKFQQSISEMERVKEYSNKICLEAGLSVFTNKAKVKDIKINEYKAIEKGDSWKKRLADDIDRTMSSSNNKYEFIRKMNELGYKVTWRKERKYITYTMPEGKKCRDIRLHHEKYLKENMESYFMEKQKAIMKQHEYNRSLFLSHRYNHHVYNSEHSSKYLGELSKQAKKEYAIKKANASSIDWENEM